MAAIMKIVCGVFLLTVWIPKYLAGMSGKNLNKSRRL